MKFVTLALAVAGVAISAPALSHDPATQPQPQAPQQPQPETEETTEEPEEARKICRSIRTDASSRRKQRVCMTKEQWRDFNRGQ